MIVLCLVVALLTPLFFLGCKTWKATGRAPRGERLERMQALPYYRDGQYRNLESTVMLTPVGKTPRLTLLRNLWKFLFPPDDARKPKTPIPALRTDLHSLDPDTDLYVWMGHSSVFLQLDGKRFLFDPVLTSELPVSLFMKPFKGADLYTPADIPPVDYLVITHDHWDHLDYGTVRDLRTRVGEVICGLGMGEDFEFWGYRPEQIHEMVWDDSLALTSGLTIHCLTSRHFSGRLFSRNKTLWASYLIDGSKRLFVSGDGGYGERFVEFGKRFPNIDLAFMENGQYSEQWRYNHLLPHKLVQAIDELAPRRVMSYHNSKFALAPHPWHEPLDSLSHNAEGKPWELLTPRIGEVVYLDSTQTFEKWWRALTPDAPCPKGE